MIQAHDFRKSDWGMSISQVKASETNKLIKESDKILAYQATVAGYKCIINYRFAYNKLITAEYSILDKYENLSKYVNEYNRIKGGLSLKYGKALEDEVVWKNDTYRSYFEKWGLAVSKDQLLFYSSWQTDRTEIFFTLNGEKNVIDFSIEYYSKKLSHLEDRFRYKHELKIFSVEGFRKSKWGASESYVKNNENAKLVNESRKVLAYQNRIGRFNVLITYNFTNNKLTTGEYRILNKYSDKMDFVNNYKSLQKVFTEKYGKATIDTIIWKNDTYRNTYSKRGIAISEGQAVMFTTWNIKNSIITLRLSSIGDGIIFSVLYQSVKYKNYKEKYEKLESVEDL